MNSLIATPEKRKVGGSTPPLTTVDDQPRCPVAITAPGRFRCPDDSADDNRCGGRT
jgi:hypothetical protein